MIGIIFIGIVLGITQLFIMPLLNQRFRSNQWLKLQLDRILFLAWIIWGMMSFFLFFKGHLERAPWSTPMVMLMMLAILWFLFKNFWLGWRWTFRHSSKEVIQIFWQGKLMKVEQLKVSSLIISDGEQQVEIPYIAAENLASNYEKGKKKKYYKASFILAPQYLEQHGIESEIKKLLLQSPWSLPSTPPKIILNLSKEDSTILLEVPAVSMEKAKEMVDMIKRKYGVD